MGKWGLDGGVVVEGKDHRDEHVSCLLGDEGTRQGKKDGEGVWAKEVGLEEGVLCGLGPPGKKRGVRGEMGQEERGPEEGYAPEDIDTDAKRKEKFLNGLKGELKIPLSVAYAPSYQSLLDQAITLDNNIKKEENRKRKFGNSKNHAEPFHKKHHSSDGNGSHNSHRHNSHFSKGNGNNFNGHKFNGEFRGNHSHGNHNGNNGQHREKSEDMRDLSTVTCFKCKKTGHFSSNCPENKPVEATKPNPFQKGQANHLNVEEVMNEPDAVMGGGEGVGYTLKSTNVLKFAVAEVPVRGGSSAQAEVRSGSSAKFRPSSEYGDFLAVTSRGVLA
ncbi:hypothetical protein QYE76_066841 [Lolium multiflorum]|uniref:CCHC-type domain-containing protein n=1 Tax=Lolium multiflorum TaxID=4521 RepID=A0AAD8WA75_LOLMU|nr:hypothetical protein QYE76_066841 [Lolium multiflorum]